MLTHDQIKIPCIKTEKLFDIWAEHISLEDSIEKIPRIKDKFKIVTSSVILINEGQFFPDLFEFVNKLLVKGKKVYVCGLDGDFERKKFGAILDLIPLCDKVTKLTAKCNVCNKNALFSHRISQENEQVVIGVSNYIPLCRICYVNRNEIVATKSASTTCHEMEWIQGI
jgi:thymidine kinase